MQCPGAVHGLPGTWGAGARPRCYLAGTHLRTGVGKQSCKKPWHSGRAQRLVPAAGTASASPPGPDKSPSNSSNSNSSSSSSSVWAQMIPPRESLQLLADSWSLLRSCFWPVLLIYAVKDMAAFLLHRLGHRLTNFVAEMVLGLPLSSITNPWWLLLDSRFLEHNYGYQAIIALVFFLCLPLNILLNSYALSATMQVAKRQGTAAGPSSAPRSDPTTALPAATGLSQTEASPGTGAGAGAGAGVTGGGDGATSASNGPMGRAAEGMAGSTGTASVGSDSTSLSNSRNGSTSAGAGTGAAAGAGPGSKAQGAAAHQTWFEQAASVLGLRSAPSTGSASASSTTNSGTTNSTTAAAVDTASSAVQPPRVVDISVSSLDEAVAAAEAAVAAKAAATPGVLQRLKGAWAELLAVVPLVNAIIRRVWLVDLRVNVQALPLQALSMAVLPLPWTLPRLLSIQLAVPSAVTEGLEGKDAMQRSQQLMQGYRRTYAWPFAALILAIRALDMVRTLVLSFVPPRWWREVIELPFALVLLFGFIKIVVIRLQDVMPAAAYLGLSNTARKQQPQGSQASQTSKEDEVRQDNVTAPLLPQAPSL